MPNIKYYWTKVFRKGSVLLSEVNILLGSLSCYHTSDPAVGDAGSFGSDPFICALWVADACNYTKRARYQCIVKWSRLEKKSRIFILDLIEQPFCLSSRLHMQTTRNRCQNLITASDPRVNNPRDKRPASSYIVWHCLRRLFVLRFYIVLSNYICFERRCMEWCRMRYNHLITSIKVKQI